LIPARTDVFVIGGGPAGLAAAIAARLRGFEVVVADAGHPPIEKACGEGLMPNALEALERLGVEIRLDEGFLFRGVRFIHEGDVATADFPAGSGCGIRRVGLHALLAKRACEVGVRLAWGARVTAIGDGSVSIAGQEVRCRWTIGADGQNSRVRCWTGLEAVRTESCRFGFRRHYRIAPWSDAVEIHWGQGRQIYVTPVRAAEVSIALLTADSHERLDDALRCFPELQRRLAGAVWLTAERGAVTAARRLQHVFRESTVLIGDASGSVDAITGEGLCLSFEQAIALADALAGGDLRRYEAAHRRLMRRPVFMERLMLPLDRSAGLRRRVIRALSSNPEIFASLLAMHIGELAWHDFISDAMLPLGWRVLTA